MAIVICHRGPDTVFGRHRRLFGGRARCTELGYTRERLEEPESHRDHRGEERHAGQRVGDGPRAGQGGA